VPGVSSQGVLDAAHLSELDEEGLTQLRVSSIHRHVLKNVPWIQRDLQQPLVAAACKLRQATQ